MEHARIIWRTITVKLSVLIPNLILKRLWMKGWIIGIELGNFGMGCMR